MILFSKTVKASSPRIPKGPTRPPHPGPVNHRRTPKSVTQSFNTMAQSQPPLAAPSPGSLLPKSFFTTDGVCRHAGRPCRPRLAALGLRLWARLSACSPAMPAPFAPVAADDKCPPTAFAQIVLGHRVQLRGSAAARHICERAHLGRRCHGPLARAVLRCLAAVAMKPRALYPGFQTPAS